MKILVVDDDPHILDALTVGLALQWPDCEVIAGRDGEEGLDLFFERFYRPAHGDGRRSPGSGLGLPIVKALVELHGGRVWVESAPDHGSTFSVALPIAPATEGPWFAVRNSGDERAAHAPVTAPQEVSR